MYILRKKPILYSGITSDVFGWLGEDNRLFYLACASSFTIVFVRERIGCRGKIQPSSMQGAIPAFLTTQSAQSYCAPFGTRKEKESL